MAGTFFEEKNRLSSCIFYNSVVGGIMEHFYVSIRKRHEGSISRGSYIFFQESQCEPFMGKVGSTILLTRSCIKSFNSVVLILKRKCGGDLKEEEGKNSRKNFSSQKLICFLKLGKYLWSSLIYMPALSGKKRH